MRTRATLTSLIFLLGCSEPVPMDDAGPPEPTGIPLLGAFGHSPDDVELVELAAMTDGLATPRDLAMDPSEPGTLYIVNRNTSIVVVRDLGLPTQSAQRHAGGGTNHFLAQPAAIAFGQAGTFATAPEESEVTQPSTPADFMGPSLWTTDTSVFDAGHAGHLDMLHNSPNSVGIAWERDNVYWVFDGSHAAITRYDFALDHGPGGADHSDGVVSRFVEGQVAYLPRVPGHMEFVDGLLYVADPGNNRIVTLDPTVATRGTTLGPNYDGIDQHTMEGGVVTPLIDGSIVERMSRPSGLAIDGDLIFIGDNETSMLFGFDRLTGELLDWLDLSAMVSPGGLMGLTFDETGRLLLVDALSHRVLRIAPLAPMPMP